MSSKQENFFATLIINIAIPVVILSKFSRDEYLGPVYGLIVALLFPLSYGLYDLIKQKKKNFISIIAFFGVLLSGLIALLKFPPHWIAVKEAAIPLLIGLIVLISTKTNWQLLKKFIYNKNLMDIEKIENRLNTAELQNQLNKILSRANVLLACSFFLSAILNYILAKIIVQSLPGTVQFNEELGRMTMLSFPVIAVPSLIVLFLILMYMFSKLKKLTQLTQDELFVNTGKRT